MIRAILFFSLPGGLLFLATWGLLRLELLNKTLLSLADVSLAVVSIVGILFGWRFNRTRLVFAVIVVTLADRALVYFVPAVTPSDQIGRTVLETTSVLLPLNLALLAMVKERGILTLRGIGRQLFIVFQPVAIYLICHYGRWDIASVFHVGFFHAPFLSKIPLSQPAAAAFGVAFFVSLIQVIRHRGPMESGFCWALVSVLFAFMESSRHISTFYFATAGLILVVSAIENSHGMAFRDELTGLPARRALEENLLKLGNTYTVAMIDIDYFKKFNDTYGHHVGDQVLRMVGARLAEVSGGGRPSRYGGEEFTVIFPGKEADESIPYLERLRKAIGESSFALRSRDRRRKQAYGSEQRTRSKTNDVSVTVSIGVADRNGRDMTPQQVVKAADQALYQAKKAGRNRIHA